VQRARPEARGGHLVLLENALQATFAHSEGLAREATCIAITAEAADAYERLTGATCICVKDFVVGPGLSAYGRQLALRTAALIDNIEAHIVGCYAPAKLQGPGILSGQKYWLQYAVCAVASRVLLVKQLVDKLEPARLSVLSAPVDHWFRNDGYSENPWNAVIADACVAINCEFDRIQVPVLSARTSSPWQVAGQFLDRARRRVNRGFGEGAYATHEWPANLSREAKSLRLLFPISLPPNRLGHFLAATPGFDWAPVCRALSDLGNGELFAAEQEFAVPGASWARSFSNRIRRIYGWRSFSEFDLPSAVPTDEERVIIGASFDAWTEGWTAPQREPLLPFLGMDLFPGIAMHLRHVATGSLSIARRADVYAQIAFDLLRPHAVCSFALAGLADERLAFHAQQRGIPVFCYQHNFGYGVQDIPIVEYIDSSVADYFLSYGEGSQPWVQPAVPQRAQYLAVGSTRAEIALAKAKVFGSNIGRDSPVRNVLWVAEYTSKNTIGSQQLEDTRRYAIEKRCLGQLAENRGLSITYRPYLGLTDIDGISAWLGRNRFANIVSDVTSTFEGLLLAADIVILFTSSPTTWAEALATGKRMIVFCEPDRQRFSQQFLDDLGKVSLLCLSEDALIRAVSDLRNGITGHSNAVGCADDVSAFMRRYIIADGDCISKTVRCLIDRCT
jgi:hypothetical protein